MIVYDAPLSPYAEKVKIALREKGVSFEARVPAGIGSGQVTDELTRSSPRMEVPALVDGDVALFDSTIILEYIEDRFPEPALLPASPAARARARLIEDLCDTLYEAINWGLYEIRFFGRGGADLGATLRASAVEQTGQVHDWLDRQLGDAPWFGGDRFGWADLCVAPLVSGSRVHGIAPGTARLARWFAAAGARPSVAQTFAESAAAIDILPQAGQALASGQFKRQYRDHRLEWMMRSGGLPVVLDGLAAGNIRFTDLAQVMRHQRLPG